MLDAPASGHAARDLRPRAQAEQVARLRAVSDERVTELPFVFAERLGTRDVRALGARLPGQPVAPRSRGLGRAGRSPTPDPPSG